MARNNIPPLNDRGTMIMGSGGDSVSYVEGGMLKQVSTPVETLLGAANGALSGAAISSAVSAAVSFAQHDAGTRQGVGKTIVKDLFGGKHMWPVLVATTALTALGAVVRYSRARMHNQWSDRHYAFLEHQAGTGNHADAVQNERTDDAQGAGPKR